MAAFSEDRFDFVIETIRESAFMYHTDVDIVLLQSCSDVAGIVSALF